MPEITQDALVLALDKSVDTRANVSVQKEITRIKNAVKGYKKGVREGRKPYQVKHYKTKACNTCKLKSECTTNKYGRLIERTEFAEYVESNNERVNQNPEYYRERQQIIEHQFGKHIKNSEL